MWFKRNKNTQAPGLKELKPSLKLIRDRLSVNRDVVFRQITINPRRELKVTLAYTEGVADQAKLSEYVLKPLLSDEFRRCKSMSDIKAKLEQGAVYYNSYKLQTNAEEAIQGLLTGGAALILENPDAVFTFEIQGFSQRHVTEPTGENVLKGGKDVLVESIRTNTATLRSRLKAPGLVVKEHIVGLRSRTKVAAVVYIEGITNKGFVDEISKRISSISIDNVQSISQIEDFIIDTPYAIFPQFLTSERPDKICTDIAEGRVCILIEGLPLALIAPATLSSAMQGPEDYSQNPLVMSLITFMRYVMFFISLLMPGAFIAIEAFHPELLPTELLTSLAATRMGVPFTVLIESLTLLIAFEVMLEAGLRLPKITGQAISIVGGVVVGQAAVQAKLISPGILIATAIPVFAQMTLPNRDVVNAVRVWRFILTLLGGFLGLAGIQFGIVWLIFSLARIESLGVPFLTPFAGGGSKNMKDIILRAPMPKQNYRPEELKTQDVRRQRNA